MAGGCVRTLRRASYVADGGPQTFQMSAAFEQLVKDLGLEERLVRAGRNSATPYLFHRGRLVAVPASPSGLISSPLLSVGAKLRLAREPFVPARTDGVDESIADFVERRAGREIVDTFVDPIVSGIFAGDPAALSMASVFPAMAAMEAKYASVLRGAAAASAAAGKRAPGAVGGFSGGNDCLTSALLLRLGEGAQVSSPVGGLSRHEGSYRLAVDGEPASRVAARKVVLACPASSAADLLQETAPAAAEELRAIDYPPAAQVALAYPRAAIGVPMDGFGFLASRRAGLRILGAVWNSALYEDRVPPDEALVTAVLGGVTDRSILERDDEALARLAHADLRGAMRMSGDLPRVVAVFRWPNAIPQYSVGHEARLTRIAKALEALPGVALCSNYLRGASVPECIRQATAVAERL